MTIDLCETDGAFNVEGLSISSCGQAVEGVPGYLVTSDSLEGRELKVPRSMLIPYPGQPRKCFPENDVRKLCAELRESGQLMLRFCACRFD